MKRAVLAVAMVSMLTAGLDRAYAYTNSLGWSDSNPTFTHQVYTFDTNAVSSNANAGYINPTGTPTLTVDGALATWAADGGEFAHPFVDGSGTAYTGIWNSNGPRTNALLATMTIPVVATPAAELLATTVLQTEDTEFASHLVPYIHVNDKDYYADIADVSFTPINAYGSVSVSMLFDKDILKDPITSPIELRLLSNMPDGTYVRFDRFDIDTIGAVPEPGVIAMAITGALTLIGWARLRRRS